MVSRMQLSKQDHCKKKPHPSDVFRYWVYDGIEIRTCHTCKISDFKSPVDGIWCVYFTKERMLWVCDYIEKHGCFPEACEDCYDLSDLHGK